MILLPMSGILVLAPCLELKDPLQRGQHNRYVMLPALARLAVTTGDASLTAAATMAAAQDATTEPMDVKIAIARPLQRNGRGRSGSADSGREYFTRSGRLLKQATALEDAAPAGIAREGLQGAALAR